MNVDVYVWLFYIVDVPFTFEIAIIMGYYFCCWYFPHSRYSPLVSLMVKIKL